MNWQMYFWVIIGSIFLIAIGAGYFFTAKVYGHKLAIKSSMQYLASLVLFSTAYYVIFLFIPTSYEDIFWTIIYTGFSVMFVILLFGQLQAKRKIASENMLLDLGLDNNGFWLILGGALLVMSSFSSINDIYAESQFTAREMSHILFKVLAGILALYKGIGKTILTDKGIFSLFGYAEWINIRSFEWEESKLPILKLKVAGFWFSLNRVSLNIPNNHKSAVEELLSKKLFKAENI